MKYLVRAGDMNMCCILGHSVSQVTSWQIVSPQRSLLDVRRYGSLHEVIVKSCCVDDVKKSMVFSSFQPRRDRDTLGMAT